jgi:hypothetical protein
MARSKIHILQMSHSPFHFTKKETNSMQQDACSETDSSLADQKIPSFYGTQRFIRGEVSHYVIFSILLLFLLSFSK